ncbi:unnamed protein product [Closterium sp. NIES-65]|nr:unnamed protein product [Closterium sp. NIES-65]
MRRFMTSHLARACPVFSTRDPCLLVIVPFVLEGEVSVISSRTIVAFLDWHETYVRAAKHTDESLSAFDTATRRRFDGGGLPREYSAAVYENAHIRTCKRPYRASNHRDLRRVIAQHNTIQALMTRLPTNLEGDRKYNTALRWAIAAGVPQLCRQHSRMHSAISDREQAPLDLYATYDAAIPGGIGPYAYLARLYGYIAFPAWVHTALALPASEMDYTPIRPHYARASASHHGVPAFSFIEYENGSGETVYGRVHLLLTLTNNSEDADPAGEEVAFVRQWYPSQVDECTGCMRMRPSDDELSYDFVPVIAVQRTVHMSAGSAGGQSGGPGVIFGGPGGRGGSGGPGRPDGKPPHGPPLNLTAVGNLTADVGAQLANCTVDQKTLSGSFHLAVFKNASGNYNLLVEAVLVDAAGGPPDSLAMVKGTVCDAAATVVLALPLAAADWQQRAGWWLLHAGGAPRRVPREHGCRHPRRAARRAPHRLASAHQRRRRAQRRRQRGGRTERAGREAHGAGAADARIRPRCQAGGSEGRGAAAGGTVAGGSTAGACSERVCCAGGHQRSRCDVGRAAHGRQDARRFCRWWCLMHHVTVGLVSGGQDARRFCRWCCLVKRWFDSHC